MYTEYDSDREMVTVLLKTHDRVSVYRVVADVIPDTDVMVIQAEQHADQLDHEPEQLVRLVEALGEKVIGEGKPETEGDCFSRKPRNWKTPVNSQQHRSDALMQSGFAT